MPRGPEGLPSNIEPEWKLYDGVMRKMTRADRMGIAGGKWPKGTPDIVQTLFGKLTITEHFLVGTGNYPSVTEVLGRTEEQLQVLRDKEEVFRRRVRAFNEKFGDTAEPFQGLSPRERRVLQLRFGLEDNKVHTLAEVAADIQRSTRTVRRIETAGLRKLITPERVKAARELWEE